MLVKFTTHFDLTLTLRSLMSLEVSLYTVWMGVSELSCHMVCDRMAWVTTDVNSIKVSITVLYDKSYV